MAEGANALKTGAALQTQGQHPLTENLGSLALIENNGVPFAMQAGETLAQVNGQGDGRRPMLAGQ